MKLLHFTVGQPDGFYLAREDLLSISFERERSTGVGTGSFIPVKSDGTHPYCGIPL